MAYLRGRRYHELHLCDLRDDAKAFKCYFGRLDQPAASRVYTMRGAVVEHDEAQGAAADGTLPICIATRRPSKTSTLSRTTAPHPSESTAGKRRSLKQVCSCSSLRLLRDPYRFTKNLRA